MLKTGKLNMDECETNRKYPRPERCSDIGDDLGTNKHNIKVIHYKRMKVPTKGTTKKSGVRSDLCLWTIFVPALAN